MAGGKLSPRQKMINLMYLVFIAMLALNMSKEVLSAFGLLNEKISLANEATLERNTAFLANLETKASEQPEQYGGVMAKANQVKLIVAKFDGYISNLKTEMLVDVKDPTDFEVMDKADFLDQRFFKGDKLKTEGEEFVNEVNDYRNGMIAVLGDDYPELSSSINANFSTDKVTRRDGKNVNWINYNFEGFPLIASLTKLTQMQADVKSINSELLSKFLGAQQATALAFSQYNTLLETSKSAYYSGEQFDGAIVLGRKDPNTKPNRVELTLDGRALTPEQYEIVQGKVVLKVGTGAPGDHKIEGNLIFLENGKETEVPVSSSFATITKPNAAVIAADKMNVVYRGVVNPMTISIPGIPDNNVTASGDGLTRAAGSKYNMSPGAGRTVSIRASGKLPDGQNVSSSTEFRIKDIPRPTGTIRGEDGNGGTVKMQREGLEKSSVGAVLLDFDFDLKLDVTGFSFKVSGQPTIKCNGSKLSSPAESALRRAKRGETVQIFDITAKIASNSGYQLKKISPVFIELTN